MKHIVILISGSGSNMRAIVEYAQAQQWAARGQARIAAVISNRADAQGLVYARAQGIPTAVLSHTDYADRATYDAALRALIDGYTPDLVVLAGFMRILTPEFVAHYAYKMLNIHPSILPSFKDLHTHEQALAAGVKIHGATVHGVTAELDHGPIIMQSAVTVSQDDTAQTLAAKVLRTEHQIYPQVIDWWVNDGLIWDAAGIRVHPKLGPTTHTLWAHGSSVDKN